jgi:hypothetical protein
MSADKLRCITCQKDFERASPLVQARLAHFEDWCICRECHDVALKTKPPGKPEKH